MNKIKKFISDVKSKPSSHRSWIAFSLALAFVGIVFAMWLIVLLPDIRKNKTDTTASASDGFHMAAPITNITSTFKAMFDYSKIFTTEVKSIVSNNINNEKNNEVKTEAVSAKVSTPPAENYISATTTAEVK